MLTILIQMAVTPCPVNEVLSFKGQGLGVLSGQRAQGQWLQQSYCVSLLWQGGGIVGYVFVGP